MSTVEKVVVIGSNSFSGSDLVDLLLERGGYEVHGVSRSPEKSALDRRDQPPSPSSGEGRVRVGTERTLLAVR